MKYSSECKKRLIALKSLLEASKSSNLVNEFKDEINKGNNRKHLVPLLFLLTNDNVETNFFWDALHLWFRRKNLNHSYESDLNAIIDLIKALEKDKSEQGIRNLNNFKNLVIDSSLLENDQLNLVTSIEHDLVGPGFEIRGISRKSYVKRYKNFLQDLLIHSFGLIKADSIMVSPDKVLNFEDITYLTKHKLIKSVTKREYQNILDALYDPDEYYSNYDHIGVDQKILKQSNWLPSFADKDIFETDYIFLAARATDTNADSDLVYAFSDSISYLAELTKARSKLLCINREIDSAIRLEELALVSNTKNLKTIRNEFFKSNNVLEYSHQSKEYITGQSAEEWLKDPKRKQPIYDFLTGKDNYLVNFQLKDLEKL